MTDPGVYPSDMRLSAGASALDRILEGKALSEDLPLALFVDELRETFPPLAVPTEVEEAHVRAIVAAATEAPSAPVTTRPSRLERLRSSMAARVGAVTLAAGSGFAGAAYAGVLPTPVQRVVSDAAAYLGLDLPHPDDLDPEPADVPGVGDTGKGSQPRGPMRIAPERVGGSAGSLEGTNARSTSEERSEAGAGDDRRETSTSDDDPDEPESKEGLGGSERQSEDGVSGDDSNDDPDDDEAESGDAGDDSAEGGDDDERESGGDRDQSAEGGDDDEESDSDRNADSGSEEDAF